MEGDSETSEGEKIPSRRLDNLGVTGKRVKLGWVALASTACRKAVSQSSGPWGSTS